MDDGLTFRHERGWAWRRHQRMQLEDKNKDQEHGLHWFQTFEGFWEVF